MWPGCSAATIVGRGRIAILILSTLFAVAGLGLIRMRRWGWALTLGAVFLSMCFACYSLFRFHQAQWVVMAVVNLVFFLYLVRAVRLSSASAS